MKLAMLEDKITDIEESKNEFKNLPAYRVLQGEHNLSEPQLEVIASWVKIYKEKYPEESLLTARTNIF